MSEFILEQDGSWESRKIIHERDDGSPREIVAEVYSEKWGEYIVKSLNDYAPEPDSEDQSTEGDKP